MVIKDGYVEYQGKLFTCRRAWPICRICGFIAIFFYASGRISIAESGLTELFSCKGSDRDCNGIPRVAMEVEC